MRSVLGGAGLNSLPEYTRLRQAGLDAGGDALSRSIQFMGSLFHDSAERKKDRKAQADAQKKAQKAARKNMLTSLGISAGAGAVGGAVLGGLSVPVLPELATSVSAGTNASLGATASTTADTVAKTAGGMSASQVGAVGGGQNAALQASGFGGAIDDSALGMSRQFNMPASSGDAVFSPMRQISNPGSSSLYNPETSSFHMSGGHSTGPIIETPISGGIQQSTPSPMPSPGGAMNAGGSSPYMFGSNPLSSGLRGAVLGAVSPFAPGIFNAAASIPMQSAQLGLQATNIGLANRRLDQDESQFNRSQAGMDRRAQMYVSSRASGGGGLTEFQDYLMMLPEDQRADWVNKRMSKLTHIGDTGGGSGNGDALRALTGQAALLDKQYEGPAADAQNRLGLELSKYSGVPWMNDPKQIDADIRYQIEQGYPEQAEQRLREVGPGVFSDSDYSTLRGLIMESKRRRNPSRLQQMSID